MSATLFNASNAVLVHCIAPMDVSTLDTLRAESFLLVHSAPVSGENDYREEVDVNGALVFAAYYNFKCRWSVQASVLALAGLANYHPGASLSTQSLEFLNSSRNVFQMGAPSSTVGRRLIYENPRQDPVAGDLVEVSFDIVAMFGESTGPGTVVPGTPGLDSGLLPEIGGGGGLGLAGAYGVSVIWLRRVTLEGPETGEEFTADYWQRQPSTVPAPADLTAFLAASYSGPDDVTGQDEIIEVVSLPSSGVVVLRAGDGDIMDAIAINGALGDPLPVSFLYGCDTPANGAQIYYGVSAPAEAVTALDLMLLLQESGDTPAAPGVYPWAYTSGDGPVIVREIYDFRTASWLTGIPQPP